MKSKTVIMLLILITVIGCKKTDVTNSVAGGFTAVIDGQPWVVADSTKTASMLNGILTISGKSNDGQTITLLLNDTVPGTYILNENSISIATYFDLQDNSTLSTRYLSTNQSDNAAISGGAVTINEIDKVNKTISGIFSLNAFIDSAYYGKSIRDGIFNKLPYINSLPPARATDTFTMQVKGTSWRAQSVSLTNINGFFLITGSSLDASRSVGIYVFESPCDSCDSLNYLSYFLGQYNDGNSTGFSSFGSSNASLMLLGYNFEQRRVSGQFSFNAYPATRTYNRIVPFLPPPSRSNFIYYNPLDQPVAISNGYFSIGF